MEDFTRTVLDRLAHRIDAAPVDQLPSDNIYMEDVFEPAFYEQIINRLPASKAYDFIKHPDADLPDGTSTRKLLAVGPDTLDRLEPENRDFWKRLCEDLTSGALINALIKKFQTKIQVRFPGSLPDLIMVPVLYRDYPGYRITIHPDAEYKIATMQFYLPRDHSQIHLGTSFHQKEGDHFRLLKTNPFKPNSAYAFARTDESWHSVNQMAARESVRDTLALTLYIKGTEYRSSRKYE